MRQSCGPVCIFGLLVSDYEYMSDIVKEMWDFVEKKQNECSCATEEVVESQNFEDTWIPKIIARFAEHGISARDTCALYYTGSEDTRPARCETPAEDFVLGYGMITDPWLWHDFYDTDFWDRSFKDAATSHTWIWMG
jgi:hypothetical protein